MLLPAVTQASMLARTQWGAVKSMTQSMSQAFCGQRGARHVFFGAGDADFVLALGGDFRHQRSGFSAAQQQQIHA